MLVRGYWAHVGTQKPRQQQYSSELAMEICNTKPILQYTQIIQSGMSWIADDTLLSFNLIDHLGTTIGHTLGLYSTANSQLYAPQRPTTSSEQLHIGKIGYKSRTGGYKTVIIWGGRLLNVSKGVLGTCWHTETTLATIFQRAGYGNMQHQTNITIHTDHTKWYVMDS